MRTLLAALALAFSCTAGAQATFTVRVLTPETALKAAQAALRKCRDGGFQAAVAVVDRIAVSFRTNTAELADATQAGRPQSGIRHRPGVAAVGGGMVIEAIREDIEL